MGGTGTRPVRRASREATIGPTNDANANEEVTNMNLPVIATRIVAGAVLPAAAPALILTGGTPAGARAATGVGGSHLDETASKRLLGPAG